MKLKKTKFKTIFTLIIFFSFFGVVGSSEASVDLPWTTTYDCADWNQYADPLNCDGLAKGNNVTDSEGHYEQITSAANMAAGAGCKGQRHWQCDGVNINTGGIVVYFNTNQNEFWYRWYMRYQEGYKQRIDLIGDKISYVVGAPWIQFYGFDRMNISTGYNSYYSTVGTGWDYIMRNGADDGEGHKLSDGAWHLYEVHLKMDTNGTNGIAQMWVDEELITNRTDCDLETRGPFEGFNLGSNQKYPDNGQCEAVDYDDVAVSNTGYIGPIESSDTTPPSHPTGLSVE